MVSFNPKDPEHQQSAFIKEPGRYVFAVVAIKRFTTGRGDESIITMCECVLGPHTKNTIRRLFMMEGKGTRWFADLLNASGCTYLNDTMDDAELSAAIGRRPFAADCAKGDPHPTKTDRRTGEPVRYMEIMEVFPTDNREHAELQRNGFVFGVPKGSSIVVEEFEQDHDRQDRPRPASGYEGGGNNDGQRQAGRWGDGPPNDHPSGLDIPPPADDEIPF